MSVLAKKGNKTGISIPYDQYSNMLKHEIFSFFSQSIDKKLMSNDYDNAVKLTEDILDTKYELPLQFNKENSKNIGNFLIGASLTCTNFTNALQQLIEIVAPKCSAVFQHFIV